MYMTRQFSGRNDEIPERGRGISSCDHDARHGVFERVKYNAAPLNVEKTDIVVDAFPAIDSAGLYIAQMDGLFADQGLHVTIEPHPGGQARRRGSAGQPLPDPACYGKEPARDKPTG